MTGGAITHLVAGVPVSELDAGIDWYTRFFGREPDMRVGEEILWDVDEHATLFIEPDPARAGSGRITFAVTGLDALLERLAEQGIGHEPVETYSNGVRHVKVPDPDGNALAFAEPPGPDRTDQESRSEGTGPRADSSCSTQQDTGETAQEGTMSAKKPKGFTDEERAAMRERTKERKAEERANKNRAAGESAVLAKIAEMPQPDRAMAERLHEIVKASAPDLSPKTWYGMPAYANKDGKVVCFFQSAEKFNARYATLGFSDAANLDEGAMWPTSYALKMLNATEEAEISALVKRAVS